MKRIEGNPYKKREDCFEYQVVEPSMHDAYEEGKSAQLDSCEEQCEACADGFISTHEKATNAVRAKVEKEHKEKVRKIFEDRETMADIIYPFRWFFSNNRDDALDLADQIGQALKQKYGGE